MDNTGENTHKNILSCDEINSVWSHDRLLRKGLFITEVCGYNNYNNGYKK